MGGLLKTAKEARDEKMRKCDMSVGLKVLLSQIRTEIAKAINENKSNFTMSVPAEYYKRDTPEGDGDITEIKRILDSYGYYVEINPALTKDKKLQYVIYISF